MFLHGLIEGASLDEAEYPGHDLSALWAEHDGQWRDVVFGEFGDRRYARDRTRKLVWNLGDDGRECYRLSGDLSEERSDRGDCDNAFVPLWRDLRRFYGRYSHPEVDGSNVRDLPVHNLSEEPWRR
jgi:hypothetical protein